MMASFRVDEQRMLAWGAALALLTSWPAANAAVNRPDRLSGPWP